jgi:DNA-binding NarL/FixJ family response regulator
MASRGQVDAARATLDEVRGSTRAVEPTVLIAAIQAIAAMKRHERDAIDLIGELKETAFSTGGVDLLVATYRMSPELLTVLLRGPDRDERVVALILRARDDDLANAVGQSIADDDPRSQLSKREFEVFELLRQGLTNRQIAELLFIGESTAKRHTQHVYDKLGIRSRTALTVQALLERSGQATSAMDGTGSRGDSELL